MKLLLAALAFFLLAHSALAAECEEDFRKLPPEPYSATPAGAAAIAGLKVSEEDLAAAIGKINDFSILENEKEMLRWRIDLASDGRMLKVSMKPHREDGRPLITNVKVAETGDRQFFLRQARRAGVPEFQLDQGMALAALEGEPSPFTRLGPPLPREGSTGSWVLLRAPDEEVFLLEFKAGKDGNPEAQLFREASEKERKRFFQAQVIGHANTIFDAGGRSVVIPAYRMFKLGAVHRVTEAEVKEAFESLPPQSILKEREKNFFWFLTKLPSGRSLRIVFYRHPNGRLELYTAYDAASKDKSAYAIQKARFGGTDL